MLVSGSATRRPETGDRRRMEKYEYANKLKAHNRNRERQEQ